MTDTIKKQRVIEIIDEEIASIEKERNGNKMFERVLDGPIYIAQIIKLRIQQEPTE